MKKLVKIVFLTLFCMHVHAQKDLSVFNSVEAVSVTSHWGDITILGTDSNDPLPFSSQATFTDTSKVPSKVSATMTNYVSYTLLGNTLFVETRTPRGFESIDLELRIPKHLFVELQLLKGGNIYASNLKNGAEITSLNGSVKLAGMGNYALVNASNGEIDIQFTAIDPSQPISLITMNGGVTVTLPKNTRRDVRLISRKNGYVVSDFALATKSPITNLNVQEYSKKPISNRARINGGGSLLFLSTENGPLVIKQLKL